MPDPNQQDSNTDGGFTGLADTSSVGTSAMNSVISSLSSEFAASNTRTDARGPTASQTDDSSTAAATRTGTNTAAATTLSTVTSASNTDASASLTGSATNTASNAASNTSNGAVSVSEKSCNSLSCSPALKAAVAVPVAVAVIAAVILFVFCARRRKRRAAGALVSEKKPKKAGKKWSRHLRAFSFDAELLMGGRFSSSNSIRSRDPSVRSTGNNSRAGAHSTEPSVHSVDEVAPPYRDAIASSHPVNPSPLRNVNPALAAAPDPIPRSASAATAPPPYRSIAGELDHPPTPVSTRNPFADSVPVSPIDGSPFNDPPDDEETAAGVNRPTISRGSSLYQSVNADDASDAASIRQAQMGRSVSARQVGSGGNASSS